MILLNTTFYIASHRVDEVLPLIRNDYVTAALGSGVFSNPMLAEVMTEVGEGVTAFCLHLSGNSPKDMTGWHDGIGQALRSRLFAPYGEDVLTFSTLLNILPLDCR